jgi:hypothetical protein
MYGNYFAQNLKLLYVTNVKCDIKYGYMEIKEMFLSKCTHPKYYLINMFKLQRITNNA